MKYRVFVLFLSSIVLLFIVTSVSANESIKHNALAANYDIRCTTDLNGTSIADIIAKTYNYESVEEFMMQNGQYAPDSFRVDTSIYAVEYQVSSSFLSRLSTVSINGLSEDMFSTTPNIYIPIWGTIDGTEYMVGHVSIRYNVSLEKYIAYPTILNCRTEGFLNGEYVHFLQEIDYLNNFNTICKIANSEVQTAVLIRLPGAVNDFSEKALLLQTANGWAVYDFMNATHSTQSSERRILSVGDFTAQRAEYEAKNFNTISDPSQIVAGDVPAENNPKDPQLIEHIIIISCCCIILIGIAYTAIVMWHRLRKHSN